MGFFSWGEVVKDEELKTADQEDLPIPGKEQFEAKYRFEDSQSGKEIVDIITRERYEPRHWLELVGTLTDNMKRVVAPAADSESKGEMIIWAAEQDELACEYVRSVLNIPKLS